MRYLKFRILSHYVGNDDLDSNTHTDSHTNIIDAHHEYYYCTLTYVRVHGSTMLEAFRHDMVRFRLFEL